MSNICEGLKNENVDEKRNRQKVAVRSGGGLCVEWSGGRERGECNDYQQPHLQIKACLRTHTTHASRAIFQSASKSNSCLCSSRKASTSSADTHKSYFNNPRKLLSIVFTSLTEYRPPVISAIVLFWSEWSLTNLLATNIVERKILCGVSKSPRAVAGSIFFNRCM